MIVEDLLSVDSEQTPVSVISDSTTVVTLGDQSVDGGPWNWVFASVALFSLVFDEFTHVHGKDILADLEVRVVESVLHVPTEGFELLTLNENGVEPGQSEDGLSELLVLLASLELRPSAI